MTAVQWVAISLETIALGVMVVIVLSYGRDLDEVKAERDELAGKYHSPAERIAALTADVAEQQLLLQQTRTHVQALAQHLTASEPPSSGRHARIAA